MSDKDSAATPFLQMDSSGAQAAESKAGGLGENPVKSNNHLT